ncbi:hypothetical protein Q4595_17445, partial [Wenyingzhuangia sp. 1_MG-2023]|nr:hypothetical protein [Wenyingzhuangia sp. 1_MG-2023]
MYKIQELRQDFLLSAMILVLVLMVSSNYYGFLLGPVILLGYYPFITWSKVIMAFVVSITPVFVVVFGGGLIDAVIGWAIATFFVNMIAIYIVLGLYKKENIKLSKPCFRLGLKQFSNSIWVLVKYTSDMFRQAGIRFLIINFVGATAVAQFATNRTVANVAQQGIGSLVGPILPELMRYVHEKKQVEIQATLA